MHCAGKSHVTPDSRYYDQAHPENNDRLVPFSHWEERVRRLREKGVHRLYLHQDGWGQPGYDNQHPDYLPPCREMGGWEGMKSLADTLDACGYLFGIHDHLLCQCLIRICNLSLRVIGKDTLSFRADLCCPD